MGRWARKQYLAVDFWLPHTRAHNLQSLHRWNVDRSVVQCAGASQKAPGTTPSLPGLAGTPAHHVLHQLEGKRALAQTSMHPHMCMRLWFRCSQWCEQSGLKCYRAQDDSNGCNLNADHERKTTDNNGCEQGWGSQMCQCGQQQDYAPGKQVLLLFSAQAHRSTEGPLLPTALVHYCPSTLLP